MNEYQENEYQEFLQYWVEQGFDFPCTAQQFIARTLEYARGDEELVERLCHQGIGPDWRDE